MKTLFQPQVRTGFLRQACSVLLILCITLSGSTALAQVNSGSDGHDGEFNPKSTPEYNVIVVDMADHPDGIYNYTSVNIPFDVIVRFKPNAKNTPVIWLVQGKVVIAGSLDVSGGMFTVGGGGPGGFAGGNGGSGELKPTDGLGPGGGGGYDSNLGGAGGGGGGFGTRGAGGARPGEPYGNKFLLPLVGGSGGGGGSPPFPQGGGGGGAILIASSDSIIIDGPVSSLGGRASDGSNAGSGSGGAIRFVANRIVGTGKLVVTGGSTGVGGGNGRVRLDCFDNQFSGSIQGEYSIGFQPIILPALGTGIALAIVSVAGVAVVANPSGTIAAPDVIIPGQQANPVLIVVKCANIPLNSEITVEVKPVNGPAIRAVGLNINGTQASSTATVSLNMPRGGGIIYAKAVIGLAGNSGAGVQRNEKNRLLAQTGWTANGERFAAVEVTATLGGQQQYVYLTESGKRYPLNVAR